MTVVATEGTVALAALRPGEGLLHRVVGHHAACRPNSWSGWCSDLEAAMRAPWCPDCWPR